MLRVLIAEDSRALRESLSEYLNMQPDIEVCGLAGNGYQAIDLIRRSNPDVVILDNIMPELDGIGVLEYLKDHHHAERPKIVMCTALSYENFSAIDRVGVDYFTMKPFDPQVLTRRIREIASTSGQLMKHVYQDKARMENQEKKVVRLLREIGVPPHLKGYPYLREALMIMNDHQIVRGSMTTEIYPQIAKKFNSTPVRVERAIRNAIEVTWSRGRIDTLQRMFGYTIDDKKGKPTNAEFIAMMLDHIAHRAE